MILAISFAFFSCEANNNDNTKLLQPIKLKGNNWAEKLGYPKNSRVIMLHADDIGMCSEANEAVIPPAVGSVKHTIYGSFFFFSSFIASVVLVIFAKAIGLSNIL